MNPDIVIIGGVCWLLLCLLSGTGGVRVHLVKKDHWDQELRNQNDACGHWEEPEVHLELAKRVASL